MCTSRPSKREVEVPNFKVLRPCLEHLQQLGISTCYPTKFAKSIKILLQQLLISTC